MLVSAGCRAGGLLLLSVALAPAARAQSTAPASLPERETEIDFLLDYYDQDGDHSPVTGGIGSEDLQVVSPVFLVRTQLGDKWNLVANLGVDSITSASTDAMDGVVSSASRQDNRAFTTFELQHQGESQKLGYFVGFGKEYDYRSLAAGLSWSRDFNRSNTTLAAGLRLYFDEVELYDIFGVLRGSADRDTTDFSLTLTQVLGPQTVGSVELAVTLQDGFLSTPFHEVILAPTDAFPAGERVAERLPDSRQRTALGFRLSHAFSKQIVQRAYLRHYDDDWDVTAQTVELETHFRLPGERDIWVYPILRYHSQDGSRFFGLPQAFTAAEPYFTADRDLSQFDSDKLGLGVDWNFDDGTGRGPRWLRNFQTRVTTYSRDDGLESFQIALGLGLRFRR